MMARDAQRRLETRRGGVELPQLQLDAFANRAGTDAGRIEQLYAHQHARDLLARALELGTQRVRDLLQGFGEVTVVADRIDDGARNGELPRLQMRELQLPQQVILQRRVAAKRWVPVTHDR